MISVYICGSRIQAAVADKRDGVLKAEKLCEIILSSPVEVDGRITDGDYAADSLRELSEQHGFAGRKVKLVISTEAVKGKQFELPNLRSEKQLRKLAMEEFDDKNGIMDFVTVGSTNKGGIQVFACLADVSIVERYAEVIKRAGLKLSGIDVTAASLIKLVSGSKMLMGQSFDICSADDTGVYHYVFENEKYLISRRYRIASERSSREFLKDTVGALNMMLNLNGIGVSNVIFSGFNADEVGYLAACLKDYGIMSGGFPQLSEVELPEGSVLSDWLYPIAALI